MSLFNGNAPQDPPPPATAPSGSGVVEVTGGAFRDPPRGAGTVLAALGGAPTARQLAGLDLSADRSVAALRAALGLPALTLSTFGTGAGADAAWGGWTLNTVTNSTASVSASRLTLATTASVGASGASASFDVPQAALLAGFRVRLRIAAYTNGDAGTRLGLRLGGNSWWLELHSDGHFDGAAAGAGGASPASALPLDGTGWFEFVWQAGVLAVFYGTGTSSAAPTAWKLWRAAAVALTSGGETTNFPRVTFYAAQYGSPSGTVSLALDHLTLAIAGAGL